MGKEERNLDGCYFRVQRDGKWRNLCFSDLTDEEREDVLTGKGPDFIKGLVMHLAHRLREVGDVFDIVME